MTISSSDICDEIVNKLCTQCPEFPDCAGNDDLIEEDFREILLGCIGTRIVFKK